MPIVTEERDQSGSIINLKKHMTTPWQQVTDPASGKPYWHNVVTGSTQWEAPADSGAAPSDSAPDSAPAGEEAAKSSGPDEWLEARDPASGALYYYNPARGETRWDAPEEAPGPADEPSAAASAPEAAETVTAAKPLSLHDELASVVAAVQEPQRPFPTASASSSNGQWVEYSSTVSFQRGGRGGTWATAGAQSYWDRAGIPSDRSDRQMSIFTDSSTVQEQMRRHSGANAAGGSKKKRPGADSGSHEPEVDWKAHNRATKAKKLLQAKQALLEDDD